MRTQVRLLKTIISLAVLSSAVSAQQTGTETPDQTPQKGLLPDVSYGISQIETVSNANGSVSLKIPIVSLPKDRDGQSVTLNLIYNSKLWEGTTSTNPGPDGASGETIDCGRGAEVQNVLFPAYRGGWSYGLFYQVRVIRRSEHYTGSCQATCQVGGNPLGPATDDWLYQVIFPDGSVHNLIPTPVGNYNTLGGGYYNALPNGTAAVCNGAAFQYNGTPGPLTLYTIDGTFARVTLFNQSGSLLGTLDQWQINFEDGRVVWDSPCGAVGVQRIYTRNGWVANQQTVSNNCTGSAGFFTLIQSQYNTSTGTTQSITDSAGRTVSINTPPSSFQDTITATGYGASPSNTFTTTVNWETVCSALTYQDYVSWPTTPSPANPYLYPLLMVSSIQLPSQSGGLTYTFTYGAAGTNPGNLPASCTTNPSFISSVSPELRSVTIPSGAIATYTYSVDSSTANPPLYNAFLNNTIHTKTWTHDNNPLPGPPADSWTYSIFPVGDIGLAGSEGGGGGSTVTAPDGGITTEYANSAGNPFKTTYPDGTVVNRVWYQNDPSNATQTEVGTGSLSLPPVNTFCSLEARSVPNTSGNPTKTAIKTKSVNANGNITTAVEYDWVAYSALTFDSTGQINGATGLTTRRTTKSTYYDPTASSGNLCTQGYYCDPAANQTAGLIKSRQVIGDGPGGRKEFCYDSATSSGNLTVEANWDSTKGGTNASTLVNCATGRSGLTSVAIAPFSASYDAYGNVVSKQDGNGNLTQYTYGSVGTQTSLYPTLTTLPDSSTIQRTFDLATGVTLTETDQNGVVTYAACGTSTYPACVGSVTQSPDIFGRTTQIVQTDHTTTMEYSDPSRYFITRTDLLEAGDQALVRVKRFDQLGRIRLTQQLEAPDSSIETDETAGIIVKSEYFYSGPNSYTVVSNPYRSPADTTTTETQGWARTVFDQMDRVVEEQIFPGSTIPTTQTTGGLGPLTHSYVADTTTIVDEALNKKITQVDALGRMIGVTEDPSTLNYITSYSYDALDDMTGVSQNGSAQTRTFVFDSLKRLSSATNPESGFTSYTYDADGNLKTRTDGRLVLTTNNYDTLDRITSKTYTLPTPNPPSSTPNAPPTASTPSVTYCYDGLLASVGSCVTPSTAIPYAIGRLTSVGSSATTTNFISYDTHGQVLTNAQTPSGATNPFTYLYSYNLAGGMGSITYPTGRKITYGFDGAGRVNQVSGLLGTTTTNYTDAQSLIGYAPQGAIASLKLGNGLVETTTFNSRLQETGIIAGSLLTLGYGYSSTQNNGNLLSQSITDGSTNTTFSQGYVYDGVNRLELAAENATPNPSTLTASATCSSSITSSNWCQTYAYDAYGNRGLLTGSNDASAGVPLLLSDSATGLHTPPFNSNNQWTAAGVTYDGAGNLTDVVETPNSLHMTYDAENRQVTTTSTMSGTNTSVTYAYDGDGRRVSKVVGGVTTTYLYDAKGDLAAEYTTGTNPESGLQYLTADALGSTRLMTNSSGGVISRSDDVPFGQEIPSTWGSRSDYQPDPNEVLKFTGKVRDTETGLDYFGARYLTGAQGRFTNPDPKSFPHDITDPQSWEKYGYTRNNPLRYIDNDGEDWQDSLRGAINAFTSDNAFGAGRINSDNSDFRTGQAIGDALATVQGTVETLAGIGGELGGTLLDSTGAGAAIGVPAQVVSAAAISQGASTIAIAGGNLTASAFADTNGTSGGERAGKPFTKKGRGEVIDQNKEANGGKTVCEGCRQETTPSQQSKKGVPTPGNETRVDHIYPKSEGGDGSPSNGRVLCSTCNLKKSNKLPDPSVGRDPQGHPLN